MKPIMLIGLVLIVLGIGALAYKGITYTTREKIIDLGPIQASADTQKTLPVSPIVGALAIRAELVWSLLGARSRSLTIGPV